MADIDEGAYFRAMELRSALQTGLITPVQMLSGQSLPEILEEEEDSD